MKTGAQLIAKERERQLSQEGWTAATDDAFTRGDLAMAAAAYSISAVKEIAEDSELTRMMQYLWPWGGDWWKPKTPMRDLIRAGALIAAEIDRLQRIAKS